MKNKLIKLTFSMLSAMVVGLSVSSCSVEDGIDGINGINGIEGADGADGTDGADGVDNSGKTFIVLFGDITDAEANQLIAENLGSDTQFLHVLNTTQLTTLDMTEFTETNALLELIIQDNDLLSSVLIPNLNLVNRDIIIDNNSVLTSVSLPDLVQVRDDLKLLDNDEITTIDFSNLTKIGDKLSIEDNELLTSIEFPLLTEIGDNITIDYNEVLTSITFPSLITAGKEIDIQDNYDLNTISFPVLETIIENLQIEDNEMLTALELPKLATIGGSVGGEGGGETLVVDNDLLENFSLPSLTTFGSSEIRFDDNKFSVMTVSELLVQLAAIAPALESAFIDLRQSPEAEPNAAGQEAATTLRNNSNTVNVDCTSNKPV